MSKPKATFTGKQYETHRLSTIYMPVRSQKKNLQEI